METTDQELIDKLIEMGYEKDVAEKMAKSRKHMEKSLVSESIVTKINKFLKTKRIEE